MWVAAPKNGRSLDTLRENCGIIRKQASTDGGVLWKVVRVNIVQVRRKDRSLRDPREARSRVRKAPCLIIGYDFLQEAVIFTSHVNQIPGHVHSNSHLWSKGRGTLSPYWSEMGRTGKQKRCFVPLGQRKITHVCNDSPETPGTWLGSFDASTILSGPSTNRLPCLSCFAKLT
ncbi:hypothetical protein TNCV_785421 [Trichonephila clavipes]|nr:hypothetical protein TNCV_785421 [Trichonephila clavipes]